MNGTKEIPPNVSSAPVLLGATVPSIIIAFSLVGTRLLTRVRQRRFGIDDFCLVVGVITATGYYISFVTAISLGFDRHVYYLNLSQISKLSHLLLCLAGFYVWTVTFIKLSLAFMLLRIQDGKGWRIGIYVLIVAVFSNGLAANMVDLLRCQPLQAWWDFSYPRSHCRSIIWTRNWLFTASGLFFFTDVIFSILPLFILYRVKLPLRERLLVCGLMCLGLIATCAFIPKLISIRTLSPTYDFSWNNGFIGMWSFIEICLGMIAASAPPLKSTVERLLQRLGILSATELRSKAQSSHNSQIQEMLPNSYRQDSDVVTNKTTGSSVKPSQKI